MYDENKCLVAKKIAQIIMWLAQKRTDVSLTPEYNA